MTVASARRGYVVKSDAGWVLIVRPMLYAHRLQEFPEEGYGAGRYWCYATGEAAILAALAWSISADTEPVGWTRHGGART